MAIDASSLLATAKTLSTSPAISGVIKGEVRYRTVCNRAYYSAYHAVREAVRNQFTLSTDYDPSHISMIEALSKSQDDDVKGLGVLLNNMRLNRHKADYKIHKDYPEAEADQHLTHAEEVLAMITTCKDKLPKPPGDRHHF